MFKSQSKNARIGVWNARLRFVFFDVLALMLCACFDSAPKADQRLVAAFVELRVAEQLYGGDSPMGRLVRRDVLKKYDYTRESFIKACDKVLDNEKLWMVFQVAVSDRIDSLLGIPKVVPVQKKGKK